MRSKFYIEKRDCVKFKDLLNIVTGYVIAAVLLLMTISLKAVAVMFVLYALFYLLLSYECHKRYRAKREYYWRRGETRQQQDVFKNSVEGFPLNGKKWKALDQ